MSYYDDAKYCEVVEADGSACYQFVNESEHPFHCPDHAAQGLFCWYCGHDASQGLHAADCLDPFEYAFHRDVIAPDGTVVSMAEPLPWLASKWAQEAAERAAARALRESNNTKQVVDNSYYPLVATSDVTGSSEQVRAGR